MRLLILFGLIITFHQSFGQSSLRETLQKDFAESRKKPYSTHQNWWTSDTSNVFSRDSIFFHNNPIYYLEEAEVCKFLSWSFTSKSSISQSAYFPCIGHGYFVTAINGSGNYRFKFKQSGNNLLLKLINYKHQVRWFTVSRLLEYDASRKTSYPLMILVRLKNNEL
ncbi:hypothetical protein [Hymenobacter sp. HDW8]|uniref:hypothetical protein n=1 Tax=Hymenobacter sp. HDW8 TaxID=2714932 RepID=UPI00140976FE|nr:hypothetical protein [Hymenobacter sp. HDW8]QIL75345.1 hypothetical protein G7064_05410 [Hymenobacter sp. HDW8]